MGGGGGGGKERGTRENNDWRLLAVPVWKLANNLPRTDRHSVIHRFQVSEASVPDGSLWKNSTRRINGQSVIAPPPPPPPKKKKI